MSLVIHESWRAFLGDEFAKEYMRELRAFLVEEKRHHPIVPRGDQMFNAFDSTPLDRVKVVILGQDPYHGPHQAHGLAFSVPEGVAIPPSLRNIFQELRTDMGCERLHGDLTHWAHEGVLLLNTILSVRLSEPLSHKNRGWERFTDEVIRRLSAHTEHCVFILWGAPAGQKASLIDGTRHLILRAPHPSPLSAYRGFFGSSPFSRTNAYLRSHGIDPIQWCR